MRFRVALLQIAGQARDQTANFTRGEKACRDAAGNGADLVLFPEMWNIGYSGFPAGDETAMQA